MTIGVRLDVIDVPLQIVAHVTNAYLGVKKHESSDNICRRDGLLIGCVNTIL